MFVDAGGSGTSASCVTFGDLPDPDGRYVSLKGNESYRRYQMCVPPIFDINSKLSNPPSTLDSQRKACLCPLQDEDVIISFHARRRTSAAPTCLYSIASRSSMKTRVSVTGLISLRPRNVLGPWTRPLVLGLHPRKSISWTMLMTLLRNFKI